MQKTRLIPVNANNGAWTMIRCTIFATKMAIVEDGSANAGVQQGLEYQLLTHAGNDNIAAGPTITVPANLSQEPIMIEGYPGDHPPSTVPIGNGGSTPYPVSPGGPVTQGTPVIQVRSASANATTVAVTEWSA